MVKIVDYTFSRTKISAYSIMVGLFIGVFNIKFPLIDFTMSATFLMWLVAAIISVVILHEGVHGLVAVLFGQRPLFGLKLPLVYVTFTGKIPRNQFIMVALAPLIILNVVFGTLFAMNSLKVFSFFCLIINTLGSVGDMWMTFKLLPHEGGTLVQDTKTGIEVWE
jgi:hypothetical protein